MVWPGKVQFHRRQVNDERDKCYEGRQAPGIEGVLNDPSTLASDPVDHAAIGSHVGESPPDVKAHRVQPEEGGEE